ncbi:MAG: thymidine phosphorylase [Treponema sp.]|jgi:pyrimidine-nucleoside phosphorylase|nr:thymidine phosphorylase [Treponema sp.]
MRVVDIITKKRDGGTLAKEEIAFIVNGYVDGSIPEYQVSAWLMAVFFKGMAPEETVFLTEVMLNSGTRINFDGIPGPFIDKHSTGGVGDKISLVIAPLLASVGIRVPMMSGRALGHTGGTLDKLEAIPGYRTNLSLAEFRRGLAEEGFAMTGQSKDIVPADRLLYALRDVTATVESIPLITASILSKKIAEGADALVFDVKYGSGAFMKEKSQASALAHSLVNVGTALGKRISTLLTDMDEPLGNAVGNFLEVEEALDCLEGNGPADVMEVSFALAANACVLGGKASCVEEGLELCKRALESGLPRELFLANVERQGGDVKRLLEMRGNYRSQYVYDLKAEQSAYITRIDAYKVGLAGVYLGVGRNRVEDVVSPVAGVLLHKKRGDWTNVGETVMTAYAKDDNSLREALSLLKDAVSYGETKPSNSDWTNGLIASQRRLDRTGRSS